jgi:hypothetical protein
MDAQLATIHNFTNDVCWTNDNHWLCLQFMLLAQNSITTTCTVASLINIPADGVACKVQSPPHPHPATLGYLTGDFCAFTTNP